MSAAEALPEVDQYEDIRTIARSEIKDVVKLSPRHIDRLEKKGDFPKRIRLGGNKVGWFVKDIRAYLLSRVVTMPANDQDE